MLNKSVEPFFKAFHAGFHKVCGGRVLDLFHARELMTLVVGSTNYDWTEFENQADYKVSNNVLALFRVTFLKVMYFANSSLRKLFYFESEKCGNCHLVSAFWYFFYFIN